MSSDPLRKAQRDFLNGRYAKVIAQLEPLSLTYRDSHLFYYLIGSSCLFTGDIGGASTYLRRAEQLNFRHTKTLAALAAVHVRRGETDKAVQLYLDILEREPENRFAQKALYFLRSNSDSEKITKSVNSGGISVLYPKPAVGIRRSIKAVLVFALFGLFAYVLLCLTPNAIHRIKDAAPIRNGLENFNLSKEEKENPVSLSGSFDFILIDCPPSLGLLTVNAMTASTEVLVPIQCEYYALEGVSQLLTTIRLIQKNLNPNLGIIGILLTMFDKRVNLSTQVAKEVHRYFKEKVFRTIIPRNIKLTEAPSFGKPIFLYDIRSPGAMSYLNLANEVITRSKQGGGA